MGKMGGLSKIRRVCSHPQSLAQCRACSPEHLRTWRRFPSRATRKAAARARDEDGTAALAGDAAPSYTV